MPAFSFLQCEASNTTSTSQLVFKLSLVLRSSFATLGAFILAMAPCATGVESKVELARLGKTTPSKAAAGKAVVKKPASKQPRSATGNFQSISAVALQVATLLEQLRGISGARVTVETDIVTLVFRVGFTEVLVACLAVVIAVMVWSKKQKAAESIPAAEGEPNSEQPWEVIRVIEQRPPDAGGANRDVGQQAVPPVRTQRSVLVQSQTTYKWHYSQPRFKEVGPRDQGAWVG